MHPKQETDSQTLTVSPTFKLLSRQTGRVESHIFFSFLFREAELKI